MSRLRPNPEIEPTHPGFLMTEVIGHLRLGRAEVAEKLGISRSALYNILSERSALSADVAVRFEQATTTSAGLLVSMQAEHDLWRARMALRKKIA